MEPQGDSAIPGGVIALPDAYRARLRGFGVRFEGWLQQLPSTVAALAAEWDVTPVHQFEDSVNYVSLVARADGSRAVLKLAVPDPDTVREAAALRMYAGVGACRVLREDTQRHAMLLEYVQPGGLLRDVAAEDDDRATRIAAELLRTLLSHTGEGFRPLAEWFGVFDRLRAAHDGTSGPFPDEVLAYAESVARELLRSAPRECLLHADFHHYNILASERSGWLAIDPKGMRGDPGYEAGPFLCNPWPVDAATLRRRLEILAEELDYDLERLRLWCIAHAMLSAAWSVEDAQPRWQSTVALAEALMGLA